MTACLLVLPAAPCDHASAASPAEPTAAALLMCLPCCIRTCKYVDSNIKGTTGQATASTEYRQRAQGQHQLAVSSSVLAAASTSPPQLTSAPAASSEEKPMLVSDLSFRHVSTAERGGNMGWVGSWAGRKRQRDGAGGGALQHSSGAAHSKLCIWLCKASLPQVRFPQTAGPAIDSCAHRFARQHRSALAQPQPTPAPPPAGCTPCQYTELAAHHMDPLVRGLPLLAARWLPAERQMCKEGVRWSGKGRRRQRRFPHRAALLHPAGCMPAACRAVPSRMAGGRG